MTTSYTPRTIIKTRRHQLLAGFLLLSLVSSITYYLTLPDTTNAATTYTWSTSNDFSIGTTASTSIDTPEDSVTLSLKGTSTIETTEEQFLLGHAPIDDLYPIVVDNQAGGEIVLRQKPLYIYSTTSIPELEGIWAHHSFLSNDLLYLSTDEGLSVINTEGTTDPTDDTFVTRYHYGSTPGLEWNWVNHTFLLNNLLYISTHSGGLSVINTEGTLDPGDDTLVTRYHTGSSPALGSGYVNHSFLANNLLYISTYNSGLSVINTEGTLDPSDDTLVTTYSTSSNPSLDDDRIRHAFLENNLLYVSTNSGLSVINTEGTLDPSDDTLVITYNTVSNPTLGNSQVNHSFLANNLLYISTYNDGLSVINTEGTLDPSDDTLVITYNTVSNPTLGNNQVKNAFLANNLLYLSTNSGLFVINTEGTLDPSDDTLVSTLAPVSGAVDYSFLDPVTQLLYLSGPGTSYQFTWYPESTEPVLSPRHLGDGLTVIDLNGNYVPTASYQSSPRNITDTPNSALVSDVTVAAGQSVSLQYRTGNSDAAWVNNFDNGTSTEYLGDFYDWGTHFNDATESGGTLRLSNPAESDLVYFWFDTGKPDEYFPVGSVITARVRISSDTREQSIFPNSIFNDDWWDDFDFFSGNNEWQVIKFTANIRAFSKIGFFLEWATGTWAPTDTFEIDWIQIETPDSFGHWNSWSTPCTDNTNCPVDPSDLVGNEWIQYKLNLATSDPQTTPTVNSVTWVSGYESSGTYTSNANTFTKSQDLLTFNVDTDTPAGTTVTYAYTLNGGETWLPITPGAQFPQGTTAESFAWKATLTTTNPLVSPRINEVSITTITHQENTTTSTSVATRAASLESQGKQTEADALREKYNNRQLSHDDVKREIIIILTKAIAILKRIVELGGQV